MVSLDTAAKNDVRQRRALQMLAAQGAVHVHVGNDTPAGSIDGVNVTFTLSYAPLAPSLQLFKNGLLMSQGATDDYTLAGVTVTFNAGEVPQTGDKMRAFYIRAG